MAKKKVEKPVEETVAVQEEAEKTARETDPSTHTVPRENAVDPNSPQYTN